MISSGFFNLRKGLTLVELMIVVAIVGMLCALAFAGMRKGSTHNLLVEFTNQVYQMMSEQRGRALTTSRATYVIFNTNSIDIMIGNDSRCTHVVNAMIPIVYDNSADIGVNVGISLNSTDNTANGNRRSLKYQNAGEFQESNGSAKLKYGLVSHNITVNNGSLTEGDGTALQPSSIICFQPNGQATFFNNNARLSADSVVVQLDAVDQTAVGGYSEIRVEHFGNISSRYVARAPQQN